MRIWVSSPSIEWNSYVYLREYMDIPTEWLWLEWHSPKFTYTYFIPKFYFTFFLLWTKILPFLCVMVKFGSIYYTVSVLTRHLCEHDTDILFTSAFKMSELYRFIQICIHGISKKSRVFLPLLFSGDQSINQSIHEYLLCSENVPWNEIYSILLCHSSPIIWKYKKRTANYLLPYRVQSL